MKVKDIPLDDRPREKLLLRGQQNITDAELLAILLRTGTRGVSVVEMAQKLIGKYTNLAQLALQSAESLQNNLGIGKDKAATLVAAFEISRRVESQSKWFSNKSITSPSEVAKMFIPILRDELKERFIVVSLNSANRIIRYNIISTGNLTSSIVHPREVFKVAIENNSANIILLHNHPSGNCEPSNDDIKTTKKLVEAGKLLDINVFDHIIIADNNYISFVEKQII
ncbi:MAG: DNA repair protein RadC [Bacteroidetes bacterium]|nr:DNA repair protein RadC [Bacteroidota bacterium]MBU1115479.1 DNA repair protein RadC [Bacteroidota bacterium]MBU1798156.1 DNA repair protein RadC [Bacteroidota bacterium]